MNTYTTFEVNDNLKIEWHGGKTFNVYTRTATVSDGWFEVEAFTNNHVKTLDDAKAAVMDWVDDWALQPLEEGY